MASPLVCDSVLFPEPPSSPHVVMFSPVHNNPLAAFNTVATETDAQCLTSNAEFTRRTEDVLYASPHETIIKMTCFITGVW